MSKIPSLKTSATFGVLVFIFVSTIALGLAVATRFINFWPSDSYNPYIPTAAKLFSLDYLSQMHKVPPEPLNQVRMRGKECLILGIALMQKVLRDPRSLYPNVLLLVIATWVSSLAVYRILAKAFGIAVGATGFFLFTTSAWTYQYILQGAHQPLVMMNFLLSFLFLQRVVRGVFWFFPSGIFFGYMLFSSPTATLYAPYFLLIFLLPGDEKDKWKNPVFLLKGAVFFGAGAAAVILQFTLPDPVYNFSQFIKFLNQSQFGNHFGYFQPYLAKQFPFEFGLPVAASSRGGGWIWIGKYFFLIMPVMFGLYLISLVVLIKEGVKEKRLLAIALISLSTPVAVEIARVSQFGRNYFSWLLGMIFLICFALYRWKEKLVPATLFHRCALGLGTLLLVHAVWNISVFLKEILIPRMATTSIYDWASRRGIEEFKVYEKNPRNFCSVDVLNNPNVDKKIRLIGIKGIRDAKSGFIFVPPVSGKVIWSNCAEDDFRQDPDLNALLDNGRISRYVVAEFPSLGSSRIWSQEEEVCAYRDLILGQISTEDRERGKMLILDAAKLQKEYFQR